MIADPLPAAAGAEQLTDALRRAGVLGDGRVADVTVESSLVKMRSHNLRLRLTYDGDATQAPGSVFLKAGRTGQAHKSGHEVAFYREIAPLTPTGLVPRCYDAGWDAGTVTSHLLLEDLSETHTAATEWPLPPTLAQNESIIDVRARFHAAWWDHPRHQTAAVGLRDGYERSLQVFAGQFTRFVDRFGELMPPQRRTLYERLIDRGARLLTRYDAGRNITTIQVDAHVWNCMVSRDGGDARLIDWEDWGIGSATSDLTCMMAMLWYPDLRRRIERPLLDRYHAVLLAHGVRGYDRQALDHDYRLSALWQLMMPIRQAVGGLVARVWWSNLERIQLAVDDLDCRELLD